MDEDEILLLGNSLVILDEIDHAYFYSKDNMKILQEIKASGVTATAHMKEGAKHELLLFEKKGFTVHSLFKSQELPEV